MNRFAFIKPQLCHAPIDGLLDRPGVKSEYLFEEKVDGHRFHAARHPDDSVTVWSRTGKTKGFPAWLHHMVELLDPGTYFDGELFPHPGRYNKEPPYTSADVTHLRAENPAALQAFVIDILYLSGQRLMDKACWSRRRFAGAVVGRLFTEDHHAHIAMPRHLEMDPEGPMPYIPDLPLSLTPREFLEQALKRGHEGIIAKRRDGKYRPNSRSKDWSKYKAVREVDVLIVGHEPLPNPWRVRPGKVGTDGEFYPEGRLSQPALKGHEVLSYGYWDGRSMVRVGTVGMSDKPEKLKQFIGRVATFKVYGVFPDTGALRHPVFIRWRYDIDGRDISKEEIVNG